MKIMAETNIKSTKRVTKKPQADAKLKLAKPRKAAAKPAAKSKPAPAKRGRPSSYTPAIADEIIARISTGEPLRQICRDEHMPSWMSVYRWMDTDKDFSLRLAQAREKGEEAIAQECIAIADNADNDWMEVHGREGETAYKLNGEHVQRSKLRIETRLKLLAVWNPRKWGAKVDMNHGVQPENPLASLLQRIAGTGLPVIKEHDE